MDAAADDAAAMSHRRKHVQHMATEREVALERAHCVCRVSALRGSNLVEVYKPRRDATGDADDDAPTTTTTRGDGGTTTLIRVPAKFNKIMWFRAGTYVVATFADAHEDDDGVKVTGELVRVLYGEQIKELKKRNDGSWPSEFDDAVAVADGEQAGEECILADLARALDEDAEAAAARAAGGRTSNGDDDGDDDDGDDEDDLPPLVANTNRKKTFTYDDSNSDSDSE